MNQTYELPPNLGDLIGAYDEAHWQTQVSEIKAGIGTLLRGIILATALETEAPAESGSA
jgi:hypothetical protein